MITTASRPTPAKRPARKATPRAQTVERVKVEVPESIVMHGVRWETYEALLEDLSDQRLFLNYDDGVLEIMSPATRHEDGKEIVRRLLEIMTLELDIPIRGLGSSTWRRKDLEKGLEPDECYYVQNERRVRNLKDIDLMKDPPPDLAIEIENTHGYLSRLDIYAALGVGELWTYDVKMIQILLLKKGKYHPSESSRAFPKLPMKEFQRFVDMRHSMDENSLVRAFQKWVAANMK